LDVRALSFAEVLDSAVAIYRKGFPTFVAILALAEVPATILALLLNAIPSSPATAFLGQATTPQASLVRIVDSLLNVLLSGALQAYAGSFFGLGPGDVWGAYRVALRRFWPLLAFEVALAATTVVGLFLLIVPGVLLLGWWNLGHAIVVFEGEGPIRALGRSYRLSRGAFWRILGAMAVAVAIVFAVGFALGLLVGLASLFGGLHAAVRGPYAGAVLSLVPSLIAGGLPMVMQTVLYVDRRARVEAFDLEAALEVDS
jgi:hypothetical protein